jgi:hypothetical protein
MPIRVTLIWTLTAGRYGTIFKGRQEVCDVNFVQYFGAETICFRSGSIFQKVLGSGFNYS